MKNHRQYGKPASAARSREHPSHSSHLTPPTRPPATRAEVLETIKKSLSEVEGGLLA